VSLRPPLPERFWNPARPPDGRLIRRRVRGFFGLTYSSQLAKLREISLPVVTLPTRGQFNDIGDRHRDSIAPGLLRRLFRALAAQEDDGRRPTLLITW
jgi:hypothetical protein